LIDVVSGIVAHAASAPKPLPGAFNALEPTLRNYGYLAVGGILLLETIGRLNIVLVGVIAVLASTAGSAIGYAIGVYGGRPLAERYGKYVYLTAERLDKTEAFFKRRGWLVVLLGRFVEGVRQAAGVIAGISEMKFRSFLVFTLVGAVLWVATWSTVGEVAGDHVTTISKYATYVAEGVGVLIVAFIVRVVIRSRRKRAAGGPGDDT
jgi:membrane protein DedA with SNARE-associated domain